MSFDMYTPPRIHVDRRVDGSTVLSSSDPLRDNGDTLVSVLRSRAETSGSLVFLAERAADGE